MTPKLKSAMTTQDLADIQAETSSTPLFARHEVAVKKQVDQMLATFCSLKDEQHKLEQRLEEHVASIAGLDRKWEEESINLGKGAYAKERETLLQQEQQLMTTISILRTMGSQLAGRSTDQAMLGVRDTRRLGYNRCHDSLLP